MIEQSIDIRIDMRSSLQPLGEQAKVLERMREAEVLAETLNDRRRLGQISAYLAGYFVQAGDDPIQAIEKGERALAIASAIGNFSLQVQANHFLGSAHRSIGDFDLAIYHFKKNVDALGGDKIYERFGLAFVASAGSLCQLTWGLAEVGEFSEAAIHGDEAIRIAEVANHPFSLSTAYLEVGYLHFRKGALEKAIALLERSLEVCRLWDIRQNIPRVAVALGNALAATGRVGEAMPLLELTNERARNSWPRVQLARGYLLVGKLEEATSLANQVLESSQAQGYRGHAALSLYVLGESFLHADVPDMAKAKDHYDHAMALAKQLHMRPLVAHCHVGLGKLYRRIGKQQQAKEHLNTATKMMRDMEMGLWLERAEAELKESG
jgi:tetratricopeptide (TPR) repeat protein